MMTPEGRVKARIKALLKAFGAYYHMPVMNGMGEPSLDFIVCGDGIFIAIEAKAWGKHPTPRQLITIAAMQSAGAFVFVVSCEAEFARLEATLHLLLHFEK